MDLPRCYIIPGSVQYSSVLNYMKCKTGKKPGTKKNLLENINGIVGGRVPKRPSYVLILIVNKEPEYRHESHLLKYTNRVYFLL